MARGRMINAVICADKRVNQLSDDTCRLVYTWLIPFADCEGRTYGDPAVVRSMMFPRRNDVTIERMAGYLKELAEVGLIVWYEAEGDWWVWFPGFEKNQRGMDRRHEPDSRIPAAPELQAGDVQGDVSRTDNVQSDSVQCTVEPNRTELKRIAPPAHDDSATPPSQEPTQEALVFRAWQDMKGLANVFPLDCQEISALIDDYGAGPVCMAMRKANIQGVKTLAYVTGILRGNGQPRARASPGPPAATEYERKTITIYNPVTGANERVEQLVEKQKPNN